MIRFVYSSDGRTTNLGLGISRENVNRLTDRLPEMGDGLTISGDIAIFFAETDRELQQIIAEFIGPETKVHHRPAPEEQIDMTVTLYAIYDHPSDFPHSFVVRRFFINADTSYPVPEAFPCAIGPTLEDVRSVLPPGLFRLDRAPDDEPQIVETWV